ncbi:hypothetical protein WA1_50250 [Scytonema hofmannii PCC 7110]|uniref:Uncharacterized protein n=1 Tax=Scytonema hofmannii PCC 7110 TaxID=128403 RepID=A0A139WR56_9CYAN|nr:hypothetical protein [Scytonema hofmannii]KYC34909.1 hypothetical protein WA1_50250 [Scytonema hofmannii PCC 7110]
MFSKNFEKVSVTKLGRTYSEYRTNEPNKAITHSIFMLSRTDKVVYMGDPQLLFETLSQNGYSYEITDTYSATQVFLHIKKGQASANLVINRPVAQIPLINGVTKVPSECGSDYHTTSPLAAIAQALAIPSWDLDMVVYTGDRNVLFAALKQAGYSYEIAGVYGRYKTLAFENAETSSVMAIEWKEPAPIQPDPNVEIVGVEYKGVKFREHRIFDPEKAIAYSIQMPKESPDYVIYIGSRQVLYQLLKEKDYTYSSAGDMSSVASSSASADTAANLSAN